MKNITLLILFVWAMLAFQVVKAQQLNMELNSHFNLFNENLAFAGNYDATHFSTNYFKQWNIQGAPTSFNFMAHTPIQKNKLGFGLSVSRGTIGAHEEIIFKGALNYKIQIKNGKISLGLGGMFSQYNFQIDQLTMIDQEDKLIGFSGLNSSVFNLNTAALYTDKKNYLGVELGQLLNSEINLSENDSTFQVKHFKAIGGHVFVLKNEDFIRLSAHARSDVNLNIQTDILASYFYDQKIWLGTGFRTGYGLLATLEINFSKRLQAGYLAAIPLFKNVLNFSPSHSVFLGYMLPKNKSNAPSIRSF